jgi:hypothetical protein
MDLDSRTFPIVQISLDLTSLDEALETAAIAVDPGWTGSRRGRRCCWPRACARWMGGRPMDELDEVSAPSTPSARFAARSGASRSPQDLQEIRRSGEQESRRTDLAFS